MADNYTIGGHAFEQMLSDVDVNAQIESLKGEFKNAKSPSKRDGIAKKLKYLAGLKKMDLHPEEAFIMKNMPVVPPVVRRVTPMGGNRLEFADVNHLYRDHMLVNSGLKDTLPDLGDDQIVAQRTALYDGAKAIFGLGDAITGSSRGHEYKGFMRQVAGKVGPKGGYFQNRLLSKKQDFSGRSTIYAEPNLGFNEVAVPKDMVWQMFSFHIIRDLVKSGYDYISARKAVADRTPAATRSMQKLIKEVPMILNRAPTLMRTNTTAAYAKIIGGKTVGINPLHLPMFAGDFDGDALSIHVPMTPEAVKEAREKLLPEAHIYDYRKSPGASIVAPGHEAIIGSMYLTEPSQTKKSVHFETEKDALEAFHRGELDENTPISIGEPKD